MGIGSPASFLSFCSFCSVLISETLGQKTDSLLCAGHDGIFLIGSQAGNTEWTGRKESAQKFFSNRHNKDTERIMEIQKDVTNLQHLQPWSLCLCPAKLSILQPEDGSLQLWQRVEGGLPPGPFHVCERNLSVL